MTLDFFMNLFVRDSEQIRKVREELNTVLERVEYSVTNESIDAIVAGLDLRPEDNVLAIAGSGDQAFAMLEYGCKVTAVDIKAEQIDLVKLRVEALRLGCNDDFLLKGMNIGCERIERYFLKEGRLDRIRTNLSNLTILDPQDIFAVQSAEDFSKIYLSNVLYLNNHKKKTEDPEWQIAKKISLGGLLYVTQRFDSNLTFWGLTEVPELSRIAQEHELDNSYSWFPNVYRKVEESK